ncbi:MAG: hypothetical protein JNK07_03215 [Alphaproteobacteria bacterium]|nr:hypothetical protein [Alphaproteobacteria bacterium]
MKAKIVAALLGASLAAGCADPNAVFVETAGGISIGAEPKDARVQIGYKRRERYVAPAYTDTGAVPPVIAGFVAGGDVFAPEINQTLATGSAAMYLAGKKNVGIKDLQDQICGMETEPQKSECLSAIAAQWTRYRDKMMCEANLGCSGERRLAVVGTQTDWGLRVESGITTQNWPQLHFGYQRREMTYFPVQNQMDPNDPKAGDHFPSALAMVSTGYNVPTTRLPTDGGAPNPGFGTAQMIATGAAADYLAERAEIGNAVRGQMQAAANLSEARLRSAASQASSVAAQQQNAAAGQEKQLAETRAAAANASAEAATAGVNAERARLAAAVSQVEMEVAALVRTLGLADAGDAVKIRERAPSAVETVNTHVMALGGNDTIDAHATVGQLRQRLKADAALRGALLSSAGVDVTG